MKFEEFKKSHSAEARIRNEKLKMFDVFSNLSYDDKVAFLEDSEVRLGNVNAKYDGKRKKLFVIGFTNPFSDEPIFVKGDFADGTSRCKLTINENAKSPEDLFVLHVNEPAKEMKLEDPSIDTVAANNKQRGNSLGSESALIDLNAGMYLFYDLARRLDSTPETRLIRKWINVLSFTGRSFEGFYHYTDISNLKNVIESGYLFSRNEAIKRGFHDSAASNVISRTPEWVGDCARLFYYPCPPFLYVVEGIKTSLKSEKHMPIPVALEFGPGAMLDNEVIYLDGSAGDITWDDNPHARTKFTANPIEALDFRWDLIFYRGRLPGNGSEIKSVNGETDRAAITIRRGAELLVKNKLSLDHLTRIIFRSEAELELGRYYLGNNPKMCVDRSKFFRERRMYLIALIPKLEPLQNALRLRTITSSRSCCGKREARIIRKNGKCELIQNITYDEIYITDLESLLRVEYYINGVMCGIWEGDHQ